MRARLCVCVCVRVCILNIDQWKPTSFGQSVLGATTLWLQLSTNEWVSEWAPAGGGEKAAHVRPTRSAPHEKLWISLFFGVERCETVFVIIMKIIIMKIIIMMVIKRGEKTYRKCHTLLRTLTLLLNSHTPAPGGGGWHPPCVLVQVSAFPVSRDTHPSFGRKLMPLVTLSVHFHLSKYVQENCFSFLAWSFFTDTLLCCNIGINATK